MEEVIKASLLKEVTEIRNIMFSAQSSFKIVDYLYRTREGIEIEVINRSQFLKYTAESQWRIYVTEMSKLFKNRKTEHYNIHQFINKFKEGGEYFTPLISQSSVLIWENNLSLEKEAVLIENLISQRDKKYSHTDREREHVQNTFTFIDAKEFLNIVKRMLSEIYIVLFDQAMQMEPFNEPVDDLKRLMKILVNEKVFWIKAEQALGNGDFDTLKQQFNTDKDNMAKWYAD